MSKQELSQAEMAFAEAMMSLEMKKHQARGEQFAPRGPRVIVDYVGGESA